MIPLDELVRWRKITSSSTRGPWRRRFYAQNEIEGPDGIRIATFNEASRSAFDDARFIECAHEAMPLLIEHVIDLRNHIAEANANAPQALKDALDSLARVSNEKALLEQDLARVNKIVGPVVEIVGHEALALDVVRRAGKIYVENRSLHAENVALKSCQRPHRTWVDDLGPAAGVAGGGVFLGSAFGTVGSLIGLAVGVFLAVETIWWGPRRRDGKQETK